MRWMKCHLFFNLPYIKKRFCLKKIDTTPITRWVPKYEKRFELLFLNPIIKNANKKIIYYGTCKSWTLRWVSPIHWLSLVLLWQKGWGSYLCLRQKRTKSRFIYWWSLYAMGIQWNLGEVFSLNQMICVFTGLFSKKKLEILGQNHKLKSQTFIFFSSNERLSSGFVSWNFHHRGICNAQTLSFIV